jgi:hypothetical protein
MEFRSQSTKDFEIPQEAIFGISSHDGEQNASDEVGTIFAGVLFFWFVFFWTSKRR